MQILQTCLDDIFPGPRWCVHKGNTGTHTLWFFWGGIGTWGENHLRNAGQNTTSINRHQLHKKFSAQIGKRSKGHGARGTVARVLIPWLVYMLPGCPLACPAIWLILDETNPNFAIFICMYFCEWPTKKFFCPIFLRLHLTASNNRQWKRNESSMKSNKSPSHDKYHAHPPPPMLNAQTHTHTYPRFVNDI